MMPSMFVFDFLEHKISGHHFRAHQNKSKKSEVEKIKTKYYKFIH